ncbi:hypothetical protein B0T14DRAFT_567000 [Immersiella caudata]|uniref:Uncharacterized protein n=1 Tax=Immersiella caudata TaxID=314043 RepID=A0AA39WRP1_9PEZI|nr:hypothetical protein B0T14DRAFT_567000 [Immersiella caudata]
MDATRGREDYLSDRFDQPDYNHSQLASQIPLPTPPPEYGQGLPHDTTPHPTLVDYRLQGHTSNIESDIQTAEGGFSNLSSFERDVVNRIVTTLEFHSFLTSASSNSLYAEVILGFAGPRIVFGSTEFCRNLFRTMSSTHHIISLFSLAVSTWSSTRWSNAPNQPLVI